MRRPDHLAVLRAVGGAAAARYDARRLSGPPPVAEMWRSKRSTEQWPLKRPAQPASHDVTSTGRSRPIAERTRTRTRTRTRSSPRWIPLFVPVAVGWVDVGA